MGCICSKPNVQEKHDNNNNNNNAARIQPESRVNSSSLSASKRQQSITVVSFNEGSSRPVSRGPSSVYSVSGSLTASRPPSKVSSQVTSESLSRPPSKVGSQVQYSGPLPTGSSSSSSRPPSKVSSQVNPESLSRPPSKGESSVSKGKENQNSSIVGDVEMRTIVVERSSQHKRRATVDLGVNGDQQRVQRIASLTRKGGQAAGVTVWPSWLSSVAGDAIQGWLPRKSDSFEKIEKIGQGTYSSVYKARDLETGKIVAMKKVRFVNMDPESVRFMAREIIILRKLDHPNVMKLEGIVISRMPGSLYLVFEYMEHDLAGLLATPGNNFTESQIKCYVQQMLCGLEHCHSQGILHRDIKGSNLLINNDGVLKIGDFGLATFFKPNQKKQALTSRVVTLWYRPPELLLGSTDYGIAVDMWSVGCIIAELFAGKPIMPGRTEVEQMHKIFKLCGSPSDDYWKKAKGTSFKPHQPYKRRVSETFKDFPSSALSLIESLLAIEPEKRGTTTAALHSEFFTTKPLPCDPSSLPKYAPSKELDAKFREEEGRRQKAADHDHIKGRKHQEISGRDLRKQIATDDNQTSKTGIKSNYDHQGNNTGNVITSLTVDTRTTSTNGSTSMVHPSAWTSTNKRAKDDSNNNTSVVASSKNRTDLRMQTRRDVVDTSTVYAGLPKKNRIHYSGPLVPPGGNTNIEDMLKEHERQIQQAVRKSKARNGFNDQSQSLHYHRQDIW